MNELAVFLANNSEEYLAELINEEVIDQNLLSQVNGNPYLIKDEVSFVFTDANSVEWGISAHISLDEKPVIYEAVQLGMAEIH